jgi:hypothetical protein
MGDSDVRAAENVMAVNAFDSKVGRVAPRSLEEGAGRDHLGRNFGFRGNRTTQRRKRAGESGFEYSWESMERVRGGGSESKPILRARKALNFVRSDCPVHSGTRSRCHYGEVLEIWMRCNSKGRLSSANLAEFEAVRALDWAGFLSVYIQFQCGGNEFGCDRFQVNEF